jgi:phosphoglycerate dehydrogenase-like enzyme
MPRKPNVLVCWPNDWVRPLIFPAEQIQRLNALGKVTWNPHDRQYTPDELLDALAGVEICVTGWGTPNLDATVLSKAGALKLVMHTAGSIGSIATDDLYDRNIPISSSNDVMARQVAESNVMLTLMSLRKARQFVEAMHAPDSEYKWLNIYKSNLVATPMCQATIGIIGLGAIARWYIQFVKAMGPRILLYSRHTKADEAAKLGVELADLDTLLATSDVVNILCGLTQETYHLLNAERLGRIKAGASLINVGRGAIIDEQALVAELKKNRIYALLDVFETEPLPATSPLRHLPNATLLPHIAGAGNEAGYSRFGNDEIERYLAGSPLQGLVSRGQWKNMTQAVLVDQISKEKGGKKLV